MAGYLCFEVHSRRNRLQTKGEYSESFFERAQTHSLGLIHRTAEQLRLGLDCQAHRKAARALCLALSAMESLAQKQADIFKLAQNGDGAISKDEADADLRKRLNRLDADEDGKVTLNEFQQHGRHEKPEWSNQCGRLGPDHGAARWRYFRRQPNGLGGIRSH